MKQDNAVKPSRMFKKPMKTIHLNRAGIVLLAGAALLGAAVSSYGQGSTPTSNYTNSFDAANSTASWIYWYGLAYGNTPMTWDSAVDAGSGSGSLQVYLPFASTNSDQSVFFGTFHNQYGYDGTTIYDGTKFTNITFDLRFTNSVPSNSPSGDLGTLQVGL